MNRLFENDLAVAIIVAGVVILIVWFITKESMVEGMSNTNAENVVSPINNLLPSSNDTGLCLSNNGRPSYCLKEYRSGENAGNICLTDGRNDLMCLGSKRNATTNQEESCIRVGHNNFCLNGRNYDPATNKSGLCMRINDVANVCIPLEYEINNRP
jgi:hypothetical protein